MDTKHQHKGHENASHHHDMPKKKHDHHDHHKMMVKDFRRRFFVCLGLTAPVLALSPMVQSLLGLTWSFKGAEYLLFGLSTVIYLYGGYPFLKGMVEEVKKRLPGMMTLIAVAISAAFLYSSAVVFGLEGKTFFWELASLIDIMLVGHWIEMRSVIGAGKALQQLASLVPDTAHLIEGESNREVPASELKKGDLILVKPGEHIPADGKIKEGSASINESMLTGESNPVSKSEGDEVIGGSINQSGSLKVEVTHTGEETFLSKVIEMVRDAQSRKSKTQRLADRAAFWLTVISLGVGTLTLVVWLLLGKEISFAMERMVTVMVISCPHALGLAVPLVAAISTSVSARNGLLIRNRTAFENSRKVTTIIFDKTGTLTKGSHEVHKVVSQKDGLSEDDLLRIAASIEQYSEHHISAGLIREAQRRELTIPDSEDFHYESGVGVEGTFEGSHYVIGGPNSLKSEGIETVEIEDRGAETIIYVIEEGTLIGWISFVDEIRESSSEAINTLQGNGIKCHLLTGDNERVAKSVAEELGMDGYDADVLPDEKQKVVEELQSRGEIVAMTGDGVNDAPALAQADVGIAIGSGTDVAAETADIILVNSDPRDIATLMLFGKATYRKMIQNLIWATGYNVVAIPLAAGILYSKGIMISPALGAALMALSTVICALNAQLLKLNMK